MAKICATSCYISLVFLCAMFITTIIPSKSKSVKNFKNSLSEPLLIEYKKRADERRRIYFRGFGLGLLLSGIWILINVYARDINMGKTAMACLTGSVTFLTAFFYYKLSKKQTLMVTILENQEQKMLWTKVYRTMQVNYHLGLLLGVIAVVLFSQSIC